MCVECDVDRLRKMERTAFRPRGDERSFADELLYRQGRRVERRLLGARANCPELFAACIRCGQELPPTEASCRRG